MESKGRKIPKERDYKKDKGRVEGCGKSVAKITGTCIDFSAKTNLFDKTLAADDAFWRKELEDINWTFHQAPIERIDAQFRAAVPYVAKTFTWEYGHFLGRQQCGGERYQEFKKWNLAAACEY